MAKDDDFWAVVAAIIIGAVGLAVLSSLSNPKKSPPNRVVCPYCRATFYSGIAPSAGLPLTCPHCGRQIGGWS